MFLKLLALTVLFTGCFGDGFDEFAKKNDSQQCDELNNGFGKKNAKFVECVLKHNEKATFCEDCIHDYSNVMIAFDNLMTGNETSNGPSCRSRFVDINQLGLVEKIFDYSKRLWEIGDCSGELFYPLDKFI